MTTPLSIVVAAADNDVIGADGDMPWRLSTDLKRFKRLTLGKPMIMGRKTFEAIGKPLPGRVSIVVTRDRGWQAQGAVVASSIDMAVDLARQLAAAQGVDEVCVVGGGQIYETLLPQSDVLHVTRVHVTPDGDTTFPAIDPDDWSLQHEEPVPASESDSAATTYRIYRRRAR
ncbi:MAG: dihydrofolate reductase [Ahrensia sp.]|nr:dihydrofolate reductase [Ahrensia sp.]